MVDQLSPEMQPIIVFEGNTEVEGKREYEICDLALLKIGCLASGL